MNETLKVSILDSKQWAGGQRFGQLLYNALSDPAVDDPAQNDSHVIDRLFYIENDALVAELESWLAFINKQKETNEISTENTNL